MNIFIITEGFEGTGYGHITRCCAIVDSFKEKGFSPELIINGDENAKSILEGYDYIILNWIQDKDKLKNRIVNADVILIDSYKASFADYEAISNSAKICAFLDDNLRTNYPDGIVINGTIGSENFDYPKSDGKKYLLGNLFTPLRKEFINFSNKEINPKIENILITMGGQDIRNLTPRILNKLNSEFPSLKKHIVIGKGFKDLEILEPYKTQFTTFYYAPDSEMMRSLMMKSDLAVSAAGQTLYELANIGVPAIAVGVAENQKNNVIEWAKAGFIKYYTWWDDIDLDERISEYIHELEPSSERAAIAKIGKSKIDGNGSRRIVTEILKEFSSKGYLYLRKASSEDCRAIYDLSNDDLVRKNSINSDKISWQDHCTWFNKKLTDPNYDIYVVYDGFSFIGQVKFEIMSDIAIISVSIHQDFRGKGIASRLILNGCKKIFADRTGIKQIIAYIKPENSPSIKSFCGAGFIYLKEEEVNNNRYLLYELTNKGDEV